MKNNASKEVQKKYIKAKDKLEKAKKEMDEAKAELLQCLKLRPRPLTEDEAATFEKLKLELDLLNVSMYAKSSTSWDSNYLEKTLTPKQIKRARRYSYRCEARVTKR